jgi:hypothetical protein
MALGKRNIANLVDLIDQFNHTWKIASGRWGNSSPYATALRNRKTDLQLHLIHDYLSYISLEVDNSPEFEETQISIKLNPPVKKPNGSLRSDANHIPLRVLEMNVKDLHSLIQE